MIDSARRSLSLLAIIGVTMVGGCSKQPTSATEEPWVTDEQVMRADGQIGGIDTSYAAYFNETQLTRIIEKRKTPRTAQAEYTFTGARLVGYRGDAMNSKQSNLELSFDLKGALTASSKNVDAQEIAAVRNRAQLLRSLALARRTTMQHSESATNPVSASDANR